MATQTGRRWAELNQQLAGGRRGRAGRGDEALFNISGNELGQRSIFSKTPELNDEQGPGLPMFKNNTASGRRLNIRKAIDTEDERAALARYASILGLDTESAKQLATHAAALQKEQTVETGNQDVRRIDATANANIRQHSGITGTNRADAQQAERDRVASEEAAYNREVMRLGQASLPPGLSAQDYIIKGQEILNQRKLTDAALGKEMAKVAGPLASAAVAEAQAKGIPSIGPSGSINLNNNSLISPGANRSITQKVGEVRDVAKGIFKPETTTTTLETVPPMQRAIKVSPGSYDPNNTPELDERGNIIPRTPLSSPLPQPTPAPNVGMPTAQPAPTAASPTLQDIQRAISNPSLSIPAAVGTLPRPALNGSSDVKNRLLQELERILTGRPTQDDPIGIGRPDLIRRPGF